MLMLASQQPNTSRVTVRVNDEVASYLNNRKRREITNWKKKARWPCRSWAAKPCFRNTWKWTAATPKDAKSNCRSEDVQQRPRQHDDHSGSARNTYQERSVCGPADDSSLDAACCRSLAMAGHGPSGFGARPFAFTTGLARIPVSRRRWNGSIQAGMWSCGQTRKSAMSLSGIWSSWGALRDSDRGPADRLGRWFLADR
jgi:hypothetical protein